MNAIGYLDAVLADPDIDPKTVARIRDGAAKLDVRARRRGAPHFAALDATGQDAALRPFERRPEGVAWLRSMLGFLMEAFLGDPARGANPGQIGWRWARHRPAFPRPPEVGWRPEAR